MCLNKDIEKCSCSDKGDQTRSRNNSLLEKRQSILKTRSSISKCASTASTSTRFAATASSRRGQKSSVSTPQSRPVASFQQPATLYPIHIKAGESQHYVRHARILVDDW